MNGWMGKIVKIDLGSMKQETVSISAETRRHFLGGRGLGVKLYSDLCPARPILSPPENALIFMTGPLTGTVMTSGRYQVVSRSPLTGTICDSSSGGSFGAVLKSAGLDGLVIQGRADHPVYLYVHDGERRGPRRLRSVGAEHAADPESDPGADLGESLGGLHRPGRREPRPVRRHHERQGPRRRPRRHGRRHGRQEPEGDRRLRQPGGGHRRPGRIQGHECPHRPRRRQEPGHRQIAAGPGHLGAGQHHQRPRHVPDRKFPPRRVQRRGRDQRRKDRRNAAAAPERLLQVPHRLRPHHQDQEQAGRRAGIRNGVGLRRPPGHQRPDRHHRGQLRLQRAGPRHHHHGQHHRLRHGALRNRRLERRTALGRRRQAAGFGGGHGLPARHRRRTRPGLQAPGRQSTAARSWPCRSRAWRSRPTTRAAPRAWP